MVRMTVNCNDNDAETRTDFCLQFKKDAARSSEISVPSVSAQELAAWRSEIVELRFRICDSAPEVANALWAIVDVIEACIKLSGADFEEQMELIDREIERRMRPRRSPLARRLRHLHVLQALPDYSLPTETSLLKPTRKS